MGWLHLVGSIKLQVCFAKEPYKRDDILQKRPIIESILLTVATPYMVLFRITGPISLPYIYLRQRGAREEQMGVCVDGEGKGGGSVFESVSL